MGRRKSKTGASRLTRWLEENEVSLSSFAKTVECSKSAAGALKLGTMTPGLKLAARIEKATNGEVPAVSWVE